MSWARPGSTGGALGRPWGPLGGPGGVGSCKVYAPVNPHTKYMRIYGTAREREAREKNDKKYPLQCSNRRAASGTLSGIDPHNKPIYPYFCQINKIRCLFLHFLQK